MPFADVNGISIYHEQHGSDDAEPLLCVMGLAADHLAWALQLEAFAARHRTIVFDNRDVGQSSYADGPYELSDMAADALGLVDALGLDHFHLLGVSMGGAIAQYMALAAPERIRTLTLAVTWAGGGAYAREKTRLWASEAHLRERDEWLDALLLLNVSEQFYENAEAVDFIKQVMRSNPHLQSPDAFTRQSDASSRHDLRGRLGELDMPVHIISGAHDILVPRWKQEELAAEIPGSRLTVIERGPHGLNLERPEEFNRAVLDFISADTDTVVVTPG
jgi:pimeloyl-ACP methyl ester carboxylesterase